ncbi:MAG: MGMT family protein [Syntrophobacterales bacterium]|nr:MGMT family protein [Syntrophobacterales bacterium]
MEMSAFFYNLVHTGYGEAVVIGKQAGERVAACRIMLPQQGLKAAEIAEAEFPGAVFVPDACGQICRNISYFFQGKGVFFDLADIDSEIVQGFARRVLTRAAEIPRGRVMTYGGLAASIGVPGGARAVGNALAGNPLPLIFPCHRVIRMDRTLGGFGGGVKLKRALLELEGVSFDRCGRVKPGHILDRGLCSPA